MFFFQKFHYIRNFLRVERFLVVHCQEFWEKKQDQQEKNSGNYLLMIGQIWKLICLWPPVFPIPISASMWTSRRRFKRRSRRKNKKLKNISKNSVKNKLNIINNLHRSRNMMKKVKKAKILKTRSASREIRFMIEVKKLRDSEEEFRFLDSIISRASAGKEKQYVQNTLQDHILRYIWIFWGRKTWKKLKTLSTLMKERCNHLFI